MPARLAQFTRPSTGKKIDADLHAAIFDIINSQMGGGEGDGDPLPPFKWALVNSGNDATPILNRTVGMTTMDVRWDYKWVEARYNYASKTFEPMTGGYLYGDANQGSATNIKEDANGTGTVMCGAYDFNVAPLNIAGNQQKLQPARNVYVQMWEIMDEGTGDMAYRFDFMNAVQGPCA